MSVGNRAIPHQLDPERGRDSSPGPFPLLKKTRKQFLNPLEHKRLGLAKLSMPSLGVRLLLG